MKLSFIVAKLGIVKPAKKQSALEEKTKQAQNTKNRSGHKLQELVTGVVRKCLVEQGSANQEHHEGYKENNRNVRAPFHIDLSTARFGEQSRFDQRTVEKNCS